jgi:hypothetical protein
VRRLGGGSGHLRSRAGKPEHRGGDDRLVGEQGDALDDVPELPHIARPRVRAEGRLGVAGEGPWRQPVVGARAREEALGEQEDVRLALAQRRQLEREQGEPVVEVLAEATRPHRLGQVLVGGGDDPHVDGLGPGAAEATDDAVLEDLEQLGLEAGREHADLVEEEHAAMGELEEAGLGLAGIGERPALVAEQLGLEQGLGDRGAVDVDEGAAGAGAGAVQGAGEEALAGAGLAAEEDRRRPRGGRGARQDLFQLLPEPPDAGAVADDVSERAHSRPPPAPARAACRARGTSSPPS